MPVRRQKLSETAKKNKTRLPVASQKPAFHRTRLTVPGGGGQTTPTPLESWDRRANFRPSRAQKQHTIRDREGRYRKTTGESAPQEHSSPQRALTTQRPSTHGKTNELEGETDASAMAAEDVDDPPVHSPTAGPTSAHLGRNTRHERQRP